MHIMNDAFQKELIREIRSLKSEIDYIKEFLEDTHLAPNERKLVDSKIRKISSGDTSDFVSWKQARKKLR